MVYLKPVIQVGLFPTLLFTSLGLYLCKGIDFFFNVPTLFFLFLSVIGALYFYCVHLVVVFCKLKIFTTRFISCLDIRHIFLSIEYTCQSS